MNMLSTILIAVLVGVVVALIGTLFDKTPDNRYAWAAGGVVALIIIITNLT